MSNSSYGIYLSYEGDNNVYVNNTIVSNASDALNGWVGRGNTFIGNNFSWRLKCGLFAGFFEI